MMSTSPPTSERSLTTSRKHMPYAMSLVRFPLSNKPCVDDRRILAEAKTTAANLECAAFERVKLIGKCATEARLIDKSLRDEREEARTAEQRAELHGELSAIRYGIEATPDATPTDSAADAVMARVQAYREIKSQIQQARDSLKSFSASVVVGPEGLGAQQITVVDDPFDPTSLTQQLGQCIVELGRTRPQLAAAFSRPY